MSNDDTFSGWICPPTSEGGSHVTLAHGGGGQLMRRLVMEVIGPRLGIAAGHLQTDSAVLPAPQAGRLALTTDSYVVSPLFFPGGDIGSLAVNGTVNDLCVSGARPLALSAALIIEEGLAMTALHRVLDAMAAACRVAGVEMVTGDTKVVERGKGDGLFVNTTGIGVVPDGRDVGVGRIREGDVVLVSGDLGRHGAALACTRGGLGLTAELHSDCAPLSATVEALFEAGVDVHCLRDLTRGGLVAALTELAGAAAVAIEIDEARTPVGAEVRSVCELLGFDPYQLANEGRMVVIVPAQSADLALAILQREQPSAACIGQVRSAAGPARVSVRTPYGTRRVLDLPAGDPLPRIC